MSDMDPDILAQFQEQLELMTSLMSQSNSALSTYASMIKDQAKLGTDLAQATKAEIDAIANQVNAIRSETTATKDLREAENKANAEKLRRETNYKAAIDGSISSLTGFGSAVLSGTQDVAKYGSALNSAGGAAMKLGENFGVLGTTIGFVTQLFTKVTSDSLKLVDQTVNFRDSVSKTSGVLSSSLENISALSAKARFSGANMDVLAKATGNLGTNLTALGGTAGVGATQFMKIADVGDAARRKFNELGVSQDALLDMQAKYIQLQGQTGNGYKMQNMSVENLRKNSLAYADSILRLQTLTGQSADQIEQKQEAARSTVEELLLTRNENLKIAALKSQGRDAEAKAISDAKDARHAKEDYISGIVSPEEALKLNTLIRNPGMVTSYNASVANMSPDLVRVLGDRNKSGVDVFNSLQKGYDRMSNLYARGGAGQASQDVASSFNLDVGTAQMLSKIGYNAPAEADKQVKDKLEHPSKEAVAEAEYQNAQKKAEAEYQKKLQELIDTGAPLAIAKGAADLTTSFLKLNTAVEIAVIALGALAVTSGLNAIGGAGGLLKGGSKGLGFLKGGLGKVGKLFGLGGEAAEGAEAAAAVGGGEALAAGGSLAAGGTALLPLAGAAAGNMAVDWAEKKKLLNQQQGAWAKILADAAGGAGAGAIGGSLFAGVGAVPGAIGGGILGGLTGLWKERSNIWGHKDNGPVASVTSTNPEDLTGGSESGVHGTDELTDSFNKLNDAVIKATKSLTDLSGSSAPAVATSSTTSSTVTPPGSDDTSGSGLLDPKIKDIVNTIKHMESRGNYNAHNPSSTASGAYQFTNPTWQAATKEFKIGQQYKTAADAPAAIQDQIATLQVQEILTRNNGNIAAVPNTWYTGNAAGKGGKAASPTQVAAYRKQWMEYLNKHSGVGGYARMAEDMISDTKSYITGGFSKFFNFNGPTADEAHFDNLQPALREKLTLAAVEYNKKTGKKLTVNSAWRSYEDQMRLWNNRENNPNPVARPGHSNHEHGEAIDLAQYNDPMALNILHKYGLFQPYKNDPPHFQLQAEKGGIFTGPDSGYPTLLHGTEAIVPLDNAATRAGKMMNEHSSSSNISKSRPQEFMTQVQQQMPATDRTSEKLADLLEAVGYKLDQVNRTLSTGNDVHRKILHHVQN